MPCFNASAHLFRSVLCALSQTFTDIELIVVNDGSTDDSLQVLQDFDDPRLKIINQPNQGVSAARNRGIAQAEGEYIAFLDTDDTWHPTCLEKLHAALLSHPSAALAYSGWQNIGLSGGRGRPYVPPDYERLNKTDVLLQTCPWPIHAALTRSDFILNSGRFSDKLTNAEDYQLWLNIATFNKIVRVPEVLAYYHFHSGVQATKNRAGAAKDNWLVKRSFLERNPELAVKLGSKRVRELTHGVLLKRAYESYWSRDLDAARQIFRMVMKTGYGSLTDWKYMLPALFPLSLHQTLIHILDKNARAES